MKHSDRQTDGQTIGQAGARDEAHYGNDTIRYDTIRQRLEHSTTDCTIRLTDRCRQQAAAAAAAAAEGWCGLDEDGE